MSFYQCCNTHKDTAGSRHVATHYRPGVAAPTSWNTPFQTADIVNQYGQATLSAPLRDPSLPPLMYLDNSTISSTHSAPVFKPGARQAIAPTPAVLFAAQHLRRRRRSRGNVPCGYCDSTLSGSFERKRHHEVHHAMAAQHYHCTVPECRFNYPRMDKYVDHWRVVHNRDPRREEIANINDGVMINLGYCYFNTRSDWCPWYTKKLQCMSLLQR
ncbi:hypothetical protein BAUCODRAFT_533278 [Baudoinia panamericana UAMH 10762]|uniref:C2H2-type domain-containing protein n=1 Tax=Baudoinia panamericana (strain UAMH 10762) TaxID=717646 RepID=M2LLS5_BAUPA|nr:uncharacterized protein BAUCODRAFT_533278 [Baudoinia panamericana UAMH 10762]EMC95262.1 hypothetical protein BAUCODRAFT_533278 [Baudoinia panamericana UAMH 10762]